MSAECILAWLANSFNGISGWQNSRRIGIRLKRQLYCVFPCHCPFNAKPQIVTQRWWWRKVGTQIVSSTQMAQHKGQQQAAISASGNDDDEDENNKRAVFGLAVKREMDTLARATVNTKDDLWLAFC